jgi:G3E family GTPase
VTEELTHIPVNIITGFLGSGKTTLLQYLLNSPEFSDTAVLINEFGEVGLDHHLLEEIDEGILLLQSGCICCTIRGDLKEAIRDLYSRRERGSIPAFRRLVIETTGLADPAPILATISSETVIRHHFRLGNVITTVDAVNGVLHLERQPESVKQIAVADRIVLTKTDIAEPGQVAAVKAKLKRLNPTAGLIESANEPVDPRLLLAQDIHDESHRLGEVERWLSADTSDNSKHGHFNDVNRHDANISAFALTFDTPMDWTAFGIWLTMLLQSHGEDVLRVKGILNVVGVPTPVVIHGVQHIVHPPVHLKAWPDGNRSSRIVFIVRDLSREHIEASLRAFNGLAHGLESRTDAA